MNFSEIHLLLSHPCTYFHIFSNITFAWSSVSCFLNRMGSEESPLWPWEKKKGTAQYTPSEESCLTSVITPHNLDLSEMKHQMSKKHLNSSSWYNIVKGWLISFCAVRFCIDPLNNEMKMRRWERTHLQILQRGEIPGGNLYKVFGLYQGKVFF